MTRVNLVPHHERRRQQRRRRLLAWLHVHVAIVAVGLGLTGGRLVASTFRESVDYAARESLEAEAIELTRRCLALRQERARVLTLAQQVLDYEKHTTLPENLSRIVSATPETLRLTELSAVAADKNDAEIRFTLQGQALDYGAVREFIDACRADGALKAEMREANLRPLLQGEAVAFRVDVVYPGVLP